MRNRVAVLGVTTVMLAATMALSGAALAQVGFDSSCQHLKFAAMDRIVFPGQQPPVGHLHDHYGTLAGPNATLSQMRQSTSKCNRAQDTAAIG